MLKIAHAADFHLDSPFSGLGREQAAQRRTEQKALLAELRERADGADLVLLAGDLLDSGVCHAESAEALEDFLNSFTVPVFLAPGNHDYYAPESPYARMTLNENVHLFRSPVPEGIPVPELGVTVWGAAFTAPAMRPLLRGFRAPSDGSMHIMVLHGEVSQSPCDYNPISEESLRESGLRYLALGHRHAFEGLHESGRTAWTYPGCIAGRGFDETGEKGFLMTEIPEEGPVTTTFIPLSGRRYYVLEADLRGFDSSESAVRSVIPPQAARDCCRVTLRGEWPEKPKTQLIAAALRDVCAQLEIRDETRIQKSVWDSAGEDTLRGCFLRILQRKLAGATPEEQQRITEAARFGLAALDYREDL